MIPGLHKTFSFKKGALHAEQVPLETLARRYGTPLFVYSEAALVERYHELARAFPAPGCRVFYSVKSNGNLSLLRLLRREGAGVDIVSGGELYIARKAGFRGEDIVFAGVGKTDDELAAALRAGVGVVNVESQAELARIVALARSLRRKARICLRVNPDIDADTHHYITTGRSFNKFGMPLEAAIAAARSIENVAAVELVGLHFHIGSQMTGTGPLAKTARYARRCLKGFRSRGFPLEVINLGGGIGMSYEGRGMASPLDFARDMLKPLRGMGVRVFIEPGRYIIGPAVLLLTRVIYRKEDGKNTYLIVDAAMNDLIRPAMYQAYHHVEPVKRRRGETVRASVVGPICETSDTLAKNRRLPRLESGDLLAFTGAGAYCSSMASNYNARPRPAEVMVSGRRVRVIRRRESYRDLVRLET